MTRVFPCHSMIKNLPAMQETSIPWLGGKETLEEGMTTHSSILAPRIAWTEEPGGLQSIRSQEVTTHSSILA